MADLEKIMGVSATDIEKIMGVSKDDIEKVMGVEIPASTPAWGGTRAVIMGGVGNGDDANEVSVTDYILYKTMASDSNTSQFGQLIVDRDLAKGSGSNGSRIVIGGGRQANGGATYLEDMEYVTAASTGGGTDFGNLVDSAGQGGPDGASNGTLCFFNGGNDGNHNNDMEYVTIASTGNGTDAGNLGQGMGGHATSNGDSKYLIVGGFDGGIRDEVEQNNFSTSANASDYGNVGTVASAHSGTACSTTRVVIAGGYVSAWVHGNNIHWFPVASSADSTDAADLHVAMKHVSGTSDGTRGEFYGGEESSYQVHNEIQKITIASISGTATDVGDLTHPTYDSDYNDDGGLYAASSQTGT